MNWTGEIERGHIRPRAGGKRSRIDLISKSRCLHGGIATVAPLLTRVRHGDDADGLRRIVEQLDAVINVVGGTRGNRAQRPIDCTARSEAIQRARLAIAGAGNVQGSS